MTKKLFPAIGLITVVLLNCGNNLIAKKKVQNSNYLVTMTGIDSLQLMMTMVELEKLLQAEVTLPNIVKGGYSDTIPIKYKGVDMTLYFEGDTKADATVRGIETSSPACKTASGLGTGSSKISVINAYPDNLKYVAPEYEAYPVRSTTKSAVAVMDTIYTRALVFHVIDKKVTSVEVKSYYEFY